MATHFFDGGLYKVFSKVANKLPRYFLKMAHPYVIYILSNISLDRGSPFLACLSLGVPKNKLGETYVFTRLERLISNLMLRSK